MKEKLQKYLAGEREGFSLVELIIVIAIMAILVGVVTLAVLPNIEKSRESKDFAALDSALSALNSAVASSQVTTAGSFELAQGANTPDVNASADAKKICSQVLELMGKSQSGITLNSSATSGKKIKFEWTAGSSTTDVSISVSVDGAGKSKSGQDFKVSNGGSTGSSSTGTNP